MVATESVEFFKERAGWSYDPTRESSDEGRQRSAEQLAAAEEWARGEGVEFTWEGDWDLGTHTHAEFFSSDAYPDDEPETCEMVTARLDGRVVASLGCIDDADDNYRRVVEAELASEARYELERERGRRLARQANRCLGTRLPVGNA